MIKKALYVIEWENGKTTSTECEVDMDDHSIHNIGKIKKMNSDMNGEYVDIDGTRYLAVSEDFRFDDDNIFYYS